MKSLVFNKQVIGDHPLFLSDSLQNDCVLLALLANYVFESFCTNLNRLGLEIQ